MGDSDEAPPRQYKLKPKEFERVNDPAPAAPASPEPGLDARARAGDPNDVFALRQELRARELDSGMNALAPAAPRSLRRNRDFIVLLLVGWTACLGIGWFAAGRNGLTAGAGAGIFYTIAVWWLLFHIFGKY